MARIRSIKPEFWTDERIVALSPLARLLFIGLWNFSDDEGRMEYSPLRIKLQILPLESTDCSGELGELRGTLVDVYEADGRHYLQIRNFTKHQKVDKRTPSRFPAPPQNYAESPRVPPNSPAGMEWNGEEGKGRDQREGRVETKDSGSANYVFHGSNIRIIPKDFDKMKSMYHAIPDLMAELSAIDAKFADTPPKEMWGKLNAWLNKKHQTILASRPQTRAQREPKANVITL